MGTTARYLCAYEKIGNPNWWDKSIMYVYLRALFVPQYLSYQLSFSHCLGAAQSSSREPISVRVFLPSVLQHAHFMVD